MLLNYLNFKLCIYVLHIYFSLLKTLYIKLNDPDTVALYCGSIAKLFIDNDKDVLWQQGLEKKTVLQVNNTVNFYIFIFMSGNI